MFECAVLFKHEKFVCMCVFSIVVWRRCHRSPPAIDWVDFVDCLDCTKNTYNQQYPPAHIQTAQWNGYLYEWILYWVWKQTKSHLLLVSFQWTLPHEQYSFLFPPSYVQDIIFRTLQVLELLLRCIPHICITAPVKMTSVIFHNTGLNVRTTFKMMCAEILRIIDNNVTKSFGRVD